MQRNSSQRLIEHLHMGLQGCVRMVKESRVRWEGCHRVLAMWSVQQMDVLATKVSFVLPKCLQCLVRSWRCLVARRHAQVTCNSSSHSPITSSHTPLLAPLPANCRRVCGTAFCLDRRVCQNQAPVNMPPCSTRTEVSNEVIDPQMAPSQIQPTPIMQICRTTVPIAAPTVHGCGTVPHTHHHYQPEQVQVSNFQNLLQHTWIIVRCIRLSY